jgi:hypothetical protein
MLQSPVFESSNLMGSEEFTWLLMLHSPIVLCHLCPVWQLQGAYQVIVQNKSNLLALALGHVLCLNMHIEVTELLLPISRPDTEEND